MNDTKKQVNNHFLCSPANKQRETGIPRTEGDCAVKALADSRSREASAEITTELLRSWLEVFQNKTSAKDGLEVFVPTRRYLGHCIAFSQSRFMGFSPSFSPAWKLTEQWELQRNLYFEVFPFSLVENLQNQCKHTARAMHSPNRKRS